MYFISVSRFSCSRRYVGDTHLSVCVRARVLIFATLGSVFFFLCFYKSNISFRPQRRSNRSSCKIISRKVFFSLIEKCSHSVSETLNWFRVRSLHEVWSHQGLTHGKNVALTEWQRKESNNRRTEQNQHQLRHFTTVINKKLHLK